MQLSHLDAPIFIGKVVSISPLSLEELGTLDDDLRQLDAFARVYLLGDNIDAGAEAEDKPGVRPVEHEVPAGEQDLSGSGDSNRGVRHAGRERRGGSDISGGRRGGAELGCGVATRDWTDLGNVVENDLTPPIEPTAKSVEFT